MNYVAHFCHNKKCDAIWVDEDLTDARVNPPDWKYCKECCDKLGIDFDAQTPDGNLTEKELEHKHKLRERLKKAREVQKKMRNAETETVKF